MIRNIGRTIGCAVTLAVLCVASGFAPNAVQGKSQLPLDTPTTVLSLPDNFSASPGTIVEVPISAAPADGIFGIDMTVTYNPAVLTAQDVTAAGIASTAGFVVIKNLNTPGTIVISMYGPQNPLAGSGEIAHIKFQVAGSIGNTSALSFTSAQINEGHIPAATDNGSFDVVSTVLSIPDTAQGGPAAIVQVPISVTPGNGILGMDLTITYDNLVVHAQGVTISGIGAASGFALVANVSTPGVIYITTYAQGPLLSGSGEFATIQFAVAGSPGNTSALTFTSASINEGQIPATLDHGLFTVNCAGAANGTPCTDGESACTPIDTCQGGVCVGTPLNCDDGNPCTLDSCTPGVGCAHTPGNAGAVCRGAAGECDFAETCDGTSAACPIDARRPSGSSCTDDGATCTTDQCDGSSVLCQHPAGNAGTVCRGSAGPCDVAEACNGASPSCPADVFASSATVCTGASNGGDCDATDHCSGSANTCVDEFQPASFTCRADGGQCDVAETCTGSSGACPADAFEPAATVCTGTSQGGACDNNAADHCSGSANSCVDAFQSPSFVCRADAGQCDIGETCSGSSGICPADAFEPAATVCTGTSQGGACDNNAADHCSGSANSCVDAFQSPSFVCRADAGQCDIGETCSGSSGICPADAFEPAATVCTGTSQGGACDNNAADHCSGSANSCVDVFQSPSFVCRADAGQCDIGETCSGSSGICPADAFEPAATLCTGASQAGACDNNAADHCSGSANSCVDVFQSPSFVCRADGGQCDVAETCTGSSALCPANAFEPAATLCTGASQAGACDNDTADHCSGSANSCVDVFQSPSFVCRADGGQCDVAETCSGSSGLCPANAFEPAATLCAGASQGGACDNDTADHCSGSANSCVDVFQSPSFVCRADGGQCDVAETCSGSSGLCPANAFEPAATLCAGASQGGTCDNDTADHCSGSANSCVDVFQSPSFVCRADAGQCDVGETCTGSSGACPADAFEPAATVCAGTSTGGACDATDHCSGAANTCIDGFQSSSFVCRADGGQCDVAETCSGSSGLCPADAFEPAATVCTGTSQGGACDNNAADHCSGSANSCVDAFQLPSFVCRADGGQCDVAEACSGSSGLCPADAFEPAATLCTGASQAGACDNNAADHCSGSANSCVDVFQPSSFVCRADGGQCDVAESCTGASGACPANSFEPNGTSCNDSDPATCTDVCGTGICAGNPVAAPLAIDGSVRIVKGAGSSVNVSWADAPGPYNVYRGTNGTGASWLYDQTCLVHETPLTTVSDSGNPPPGTLYYYVVSRVNACRESDLSTNGEGAAIPNANSCPNPPTDTDLDGTPDVTDNCPLVANAGQTDADGDSHGDACDNCQTTSNQDQQDTDNDTIGDACDPTP